MNFPSSKTNYNEYIQNVRSDPSFCPTTLYSLKVIDKSINAGESVLRACERHIRDLKKSLDENQDYEYKFDKKRAQHIYSFFDRFVKHQKGELAGKPVTLELWQKFILGSLMGWIDKETGARRFTISYTQIARKNGKSLLSSGLSLYMFMIDKEQGAECYCASTKRDTAKIVFMDTMRMIKAAPVLRKHTRIQESLSTIHYKNSVFKALSADKGQDGLNIHFVSYDEFHLEKTREMYDVLVSGMQARKQPLMFIITTAGESRGGTSPCYETYEYCKQILNNISPNENMFCYIAEMDEGDDVHDSSNWFKSNPNINVSISLKALKQAYVRARDNNEMDNFMIKHMNKWIQRKDAYFPVVQWKNKTLPNLEGKECHVGIDLSSKIDITGVSAVFPLENGEYAVLSHCFMPAYGIEEKERKDRVPYRRWAKEGYITLIPGEVIDINFVFEYVKELSSKYEVLSVGLDPWNATALMVKLDNEGYEVHEVRQGFKTLSEPIKFTKELMLKNLFNHGGNPVLKWCSANAVAKYDANENVVLDKSMSVNRIDAIASTITAMVQAMLHFDSPSLDSHIDEEYSIW